MRSVCLKRMGTFLLALILFGCVFMLSACKEDEVPVPPMEDEWVEESPDQSAGYRQTVLYYESDEGMMVPVMKLLPWEEGIGKAALNQLVDSQENKLSSAVMGLKNVVPQGVTFVLSISDEAVATLDICDLPELEDVGAENALVTAVVNTLVEFPTIEEVSLMFDGESIESLPHGTDVSGVMGRIPLNEEPLLVSASDEDVHLMTLYFPNLSASLNVPVTRYVGTEPTFELAVNALISGPMDETLRACFPEGTKVLTASVENNIATVDLSEEYATISNTPELEAAALETLQLTAAQFGTVSALSLTVEGEAWQTESVAAMSIMQYPNEFRPY